MKDFFYLLLFIATFFIIQSSQIEEPYELPEIIEIDDLSFTREASVGSQIQEIRDLHGISTSDFAEAIGLTDKQLTIIEKGLATPTRDIIFKIMELTGDDIVMDGGY